MNKIAIGIVVILLSPCFLKAQSYEYGSFTHSGKTLPYRYLLPQKNQNKKLPLLIILHGAGERGNDNEKQLTHGGKLFADSLEKYPAMVVFPQCPEQEYWPPVNITKTKTGRSFEFLPKIETASALNLVELLIDSLISTGKIDIDRIYIGGLSMGGMGTFALAAAHPDLFAAAVVICGAGNTHDVKKFSHIPFWIFHGALDDIVPVENAYAMEKALTAAGAKPIVTIYPNANHNSWDPAFAEPELLHWIFTKSKK